LRNIRRLLRFDPRELDHLRPFLGFGGNEFTKLSRRAGKHCATQIGKARLHLGIVESRIDLLVELVDDFSRRVFWCADALPAARFIAEPKFAPGRDVGQDLLARRSGDRQRAQLAGPDELDRRGDRHKKYLHLSAEQIGKWTASIRDVSHVDAGYRLEQLA